MSDIHKTCVESIRGIASLSPSESCNVIHVLRKYNVMDELVLELLVEMDAVGASSFLVEKLSTDSGGTTSSTPKRKIIRRQSTASEEPSYVVPLRRRMIGRPNRTEDVAPLSKQEPFYSDRGPSNLAKALGNNNPLVDRCMRCISARMSSSQDICLGESSLHIRAFTLLVHCTDCNTELAMQILNCVPDLVGVEKVPTIMPNSSSVDDVYKLAICLIIVAWSKCKRNENDMTDSDETKVYQDNLENLFANPKSLECIVFSSRLAGFIISNDSKGLRSIILTHLCSGDYSIDGALREAELKQISNLVEQVLSTIGSDRLQQVHKSALTLGTTLYNPIVAIESIQRCGSSQNTELDDLMKSILSDPRSCHDMLCNPMTCKLARESVKMVSRRAGPHIPLVLPVSTDMFSVSYFLTTLLTQTLLFAIQ